MAHPQLSTLKYRQDSADGRDFLDRASIVTVLSHYIYISHTKNIIEVVPTTPSTRRHSQAVPVYPRASPTSVLQFRENSIVAEMLHLYTTSAVFPSSLSTYR